MEGQMDVGTRDTSDYDDNSVEGRRCFSRKGNFFFNYFYINGLIGLERPALDCGNHSRIIGLDWNHRLYRIGMASTLQGPSER
jgi:hypothetical protein